MHGELPAHFFGAVGYVRAVGGQVVAAGCKGTEKGGFFGIESLGNRLQLLELLGGLSSLSLFELVAVGRWCTNRRE